MFKAFLRSKNIFRFQRVNRFLYFSLVSRNIPQVPVYNSDVQQLPLVV